MHHQLTITLITGHQPYMTQIREFHGFGSVNLLRRRRQIRTSKFQELMGKAIALQRPSVQTSPKYCAHTFSRGTRLDAIHDPGMLSTSLLLPNSLYLHITATVAATVPRRMMTTCSEPPQVLYCLTAVIYRYL